MCSVCVCVWCLLCVYVCVMCMLCVLCVFVVCVCCVFSVCVLCVVYVMCSVGVCVLCVFCVYVLVFVVCMCVSCVCVLCVLCVWCLSCVCVFVCPSVCCGGGPVPHAHPARGVLAVDLDKLWEEGRARGPGWGTRQVLGCLGYILTSPHSGSVEGVLKAAVRRGQKTPAPRVTPKALTVLRAPSEATVVMAPAVWGGGQEHARRGGGRWAHTAHDAPPSFLALVKLQVTGEGNQEGPNEGVIPLNGPLPLSP